MAPRWLTQCWLGTPPLHEEDGGASSQRRLSSVPAGQAQQLERGPGAGAPPHGEAHAGVAAAAGRGPPRRALPHRPPHLFKRQEAPRGRYLQPDLGSSARRQQPEEQPARWLLALARLAVARPWPRARCRAAMATPMAHSAMGSLTRAAQGARWAVLAPLTAAPAGAATRRSPASLWRALLLAAQPAKCATRAVASKLRPWRPGAPPRPLWHAPPRPPPQWRAPRGAPLR